jgi:SRSO17 transposase
LADDEAVLVVDETGFLKQGKASRGVARQYTGSAGKITNCQIGVFACYVAPRGHAFVDRELYLPKSWTDDPARMAKAHAPQEIIESASGGFATKSALARAMIERAITAGVPFSFVAADTVYGVGDIEMALRRAGKGYVLGVKSNDPFRSWGKPRDRRWNGHGHLRRSAQLRVAASFGGRGDQGRAVARLGLSRTRRSRWRRIQRSARRSRMDARTSDPAQNRRRRPRLLHDLGSAGNDHRKTGENRRTSLGDRRQFRNDEERIRARSQRDALLAWMASSRLAGHARLRHDGRDPRSRQHGRAAPKNNAAQGEDTQPDAALTSPSLIRWSMQEIRDFFRGFDRTR